MKLGEGGAIALHNDQLYEFSPMPVNVVDNTGAGDAVAGGYLYGMLTGLPFHTAVKAATICGGFSVTARGGATNVLLLPQLQEWMSKDWGDQR